ncbi:MAG: STAS domain-containing protein [Verrucomicrobia bacterium]|nr:STAS domain-containing protein [Verrucomicrobiota bacterium]
MNPLTATMSVAVTSGGVCVRIAGRANISASEDFKSLIRGLCARGHGRFVLDLAGCPLMDSTFLGVLAGLAHGAADARVDGAPPKFELLNPNGRVLGLLDNLGVLELFTVAQCVPPKEGEFHAAAPGAASKADLTRTSLEAHRMLMSLNPENIARFKDVARFLDEDLKRQTGG